MLELTEIEVRVLGCLIEKQMATPDYYPMTLNALTAACNQKSNRHPFMALEDKVALKTVDSLRDKKLASLIHQASSRVPKYAHHFDEFLGLSRQELVVMCELMVRGPQTAGELRSHCSRLYPFKDLDEVSDVVHALAARNDGLLVKQLPLQPGRKEPRFAQLLAGEPEVETATGAAPTEAIRVEMKLEDERVAELEERVSMLEGDLEALKTQFEAFKQQFE